jgi:ubiquinone/menaquinone biosynthesis C-methylase UbiE
VPGTDRDFFGSAFGRVYSFYMERPPLSRAVARIVWGEDIRPFYAAIEEVGACQPGSTIIDAPCGAGVAFRGLRPGQDVRYLALDVSPAMLARARRSAARRDLGQIEFFEGDAESLPFEDRSADLFTSWWGLHCMGNPRAALDEARRCLRPGGLLIGSAIVRGDSIRQRLVVRPHTAAFGEVVDAAQLRGWLAERFDDARVEAAGAFVYFRARRPDRD